MRQAVIIFFLSTLFFTQCARGIRETEVGPADAKKKILIAVFSSEYKDRIAQGLVDRYKKQYRVTLVPIERLNSVEYRNYDALVVIDAKMAWQLFNPRTRWFIGKIKDPEDLKKVALFFSAGKPSDNYTVMGVDCISSASERNDEADITRKLSEKIDRILK
jgi:hypothetical protein